MLDLDKFTDGIAGLIKQAAEDATAPLIAETMAIMGRLAELEKRLDALPTPRDGAPGRDGKDADPEEVASLVHERIKAELDEMRAAIAASQELPDIPALVKAALDEAVALLPRPKDGEPGPRAAAALESSRVPVLRMELVPDAVRQVAGGEAPRPLESFRGAQVHAVAGIGNPARFFAQLRTYGLDVIEHAFPDHHPFAASDLVFGDTLPVLMTEKDAVKCRAFADPRLWYVPVSVRFGDAQERELLDHVLCRINLSPGTKD